MICPRHHARALTTDDHGHPLCSACFGEALERAEAVEVERVIARIRWRVRGEFGKR